METEDSADDVFTSSNPQGDQALNQNGGTSNDNENLPSTSSGRGLQDTAGSQQEDEGIIAGGSSYLPSHPEPLLPPEVPMVPPIPVSVSDENYHRGNWGTKLEFLAAMICQLTSFAMFSFAYRCYRNGGLIFVVPYIVMLFVFGLPIILIQVSLGQFASTGFLTMWRFSPVLKGVSAGILLLVSGDLLLLNIPFAEALNYVYFTLSNPRNLPWSDCDNAWNTQFCRNPNEVTVVNFTSPYGSSYMFYDAVQYAASPAEEYHRYNVEAGNNLQVAVVVSTLIGSCLLLQATLMGVKIVGKLSICCLLASFMLTVALLVRSASLPGSYEGLYFLLSPDLGRLFTFDIWRDAFLSVLYTLTFSFGTNVTLASHNRFHNNCFLDTAILVMVSIFAPMLLAITIFCFLGFLAYTLNLPMHDVVISGPRLVFEALPSALLHLPSSHLWTLAWFGLVAVNLFSSEIGTIVCISSSFLDLFGWVHSWRNSIPITLIVCLFVFLTTVASFYLGAGVILATIDLGLLYLHPIIVSILALSLVWIYGGYQNFRLLRFGRDIEIMVGFFPGFFKILFTSLWGVIVPFFLGVAVIYSIVWNAGGMSLEVRILFGVSILILGAGIVLGACHEAYKHKHLNTYFTDYFYRAALPLPKWGPALDAHRKSAGYLPPDFTPQPYRLNQGHQPPEAGQQLTQPNPGTEGNPSKDGEGATATLPASTPLLGLNLYSTETTL